MIIYRFFLIVNCILSIASADLIAQTVPPLINYQGKLATANGLPVSTGDYELRFRIWDAATGGNLVWGPQVFNGQSGPGYGPIVPVVQGWLNIMLGPVDVGNVSILNAFYGTNRFVEIQIGNNPALTPRQQFVSAPFSLRAAVADSTQFAVRAATADSAQFSVSSSTSSNLVGQVTTDSNTYYVSTNGLDMNDGLSINSPKLTVQAAVDLVPPQLKHQTIIRISPGIYRERVRIINKHAIGEGGSLQLIGMGTNANAVRISGADLNGNRVRAESLYLNGAEGSAFNLTFEECNDTGVTILYGSRFGFTQCNFWNLNGSIALESYSSAYFENCYFERFGARGGTAIDVESLSYCGFRNDHTLEQGANGIPGFVGDPTNSLINTFRNYTQGILARGGAIVVISGSAAFDNVNTPSSTANGGQVFQ